MVKFEDHMVWGTSEELKTLKRCTCNQVKKDGCWNPTCMWAYTCMTEGEDYGKNFCKKYSSSRK